MRFAPYSFSKINTYLKCPRLFWFKYVKGYEEPATPAMEFGKTVHRIIGEMIDTKRLPDLNLEFPDEKTAMLAQKMITISKNFLGSLNIVHEFGAELSFGLTKDFKLTEFDSGEALFHGIIDYVAIIEGVDDLIQLVVDWKTGFSRNDPLQLELYMLAFETRYQTKGVFVNLRNGNVQLVEKDETAKEKLFNLVYMIEGDELFEQNVGRQCKRCYFEEICQGGVENE